MFAGNHALMSQVPAKVIRSWKEDWILWTVFLLFLVLLLLEWLEQSHVKPTFKKNIIREGFHSLRNMMFRAKEKFVSGSAPNPEFDNWKKVQSLSAIVPSNTAFAQTAMGKPTLQGSSFGIFPPQIPYRPVEQEMNAEQQVGPVVYQGSAPLEVVNRERYIPENIPPMWDEEVRQSLLPTQLPRSAYIASYQTGRVRQPVDIQPNVMKSNNTV